MPQITIKDIARMAGVSRGTVDRVINNRGRVSAQVRDEVLRIIDEVGYKKNQVGSILARRKSYRVAVILPDEKLDIFWRGPLIGIRNVEELINLYGIEIDYHLFKLFDLESYKAKWQKAIDSNPDAILVAPIFSHTALEYFEIAQRANIFTLCINTEVKDQDYQCYIGQNSFRCGYLAARLLKFRVDSGSTLHCLNLSHLRLHENQHLKDKFEGFKEFINSLDPSISIELVDIQNFKDKNEIRNVHQNILDQGTAGLFFTNSRAYHYLDAINGDIPKDVRIVGFDLVPRNLEYLKNGAIDYLIRQNPIYQGQMGMTFIINYLVSQISVPSKEYTSMDIVIKENMDYYVDIIPQIVNKYEDKDLLISNKSIFKSQ